MGNNPLTEMGTEILRNLLNIDRFKNKSEDKKRGYR